MGAGHEGSIADQGDAPERHPGARQVVDRLKEGLVGETDDLAELRREDLLGMRSHLGHDRFRDQGRRDRDLVPATRLVGEEPWELAGLLRRPVPDEIVPSAHGPARVTVASHRVAQDLLLRREPEGEVPEHLRVERRWKRGFLHEAAPGDVAGIERLHLGGHDAAHARSESVRADEHVSRNARPVGEGGRHARLVLREAHEVAPEMVPLLRKAAAQDGEEPVPGRRDLAP